MKKFVVLTGFLLLLFSQGVQSQSLGFSYFFPKDGYFSNPIAPLQFSLPISFGDYVQVVPGISMNSIGGMSLNNLDEDLDSRRPLVGPFQSFSGTLLPAAVIPAKTFRIKIKGGVFAFATMNTRLMTGNFDDMYREAYNYRAVTSHISSDKDPLGWGYVFGTKVSFRIKKNIWGYVEGKYYIGSQGMALDGKVNYGNNESMDVSYPDAALNYQGFELTIGGTLKKKK